MASFIEYTKYNMPISQFNKRKPLSYLSEFSQKLKKTRTGLLLNM